MFGYPLGLIVAAKCNGRERNEGWRIEVVFKIVVALKAFLCLLRPIPVEATSFLNLLYLLKS